MSQLTIRLVHSSRDGFVLHTDTAIEGDVPFTVTLFYDHTRGTLRNDAIFALDAFLRDVVQGEMPAVAS